MSSEAAALLDQLMGRNRNAVDGDSVKQEHWSDPEVSTVIDRYSGGYN